MFVEDHIDSQEEKGDPVADRGSPSSSSYSKGWESKFTENQSKTQKQCKRDRKDTKH
ncbi:hypothetical protein TUM19329_23440 [Legionella antarctica]|uniref:Uncharacterized protein n=1 Tax=Legionella antarctica TaxID=2708020 RepID=A0A6F8T6Z1_9GAMM|nr:hypothetical protein TUM19329_23440 [Legionella antarctica]